MHVIATDRLICFRDDEGAEKNPLQKSVRKPGMLLKTRVEKISTFCLSTMLMITNELHRSFHDVDEKKGSYWKWAETENG
jgi:hypothetical protein